MDFLSASHILHLLLEVVAERRKPETSVVRAAMSNTNLGKSLGRRLSWSRAPGFNDNESQNVCIIYIKCLYIKLS